MGTYSLSTLLIGVALGFCSALLAALVGSMLLRRGARFPFRFLSKVGRRSSLHEAEHALGDFSAELEGVRQKFNILGSYITEYFNTFQAAGWDDLRLLLDDLQLTEDSLKLLLENGRYADVRDISWYLTGKLSDGDAKSLMERYDGLEPLRNWRKDSRAVLLRVVRASIDSAQRTAAVGISRKRSAKPTLVTLAELRSVLGDSRH